MTHEICLKQSKRREQPTASSTVLRHDHPTANNDIFYESTILSMGKAVLRLAATLQATV